MICTTCNGNGWLYSDSGPAPREITCPECDGVGVYEEDDPCSGEITPCATCFPEGLPRLSCGGVGVNYTVMPDGRIKW